MNDARKQIIELISDYMDKTLSEGCLLNWGKLINEDDVLTTEGDILLAPEIEKEEILGHYDITAVLKYIHKCKGAFDIMYGESGNIIITHYNSGRKQYDFPGKPLTLYTEQEEKDLLELLQKLGNK